MLPSAKNAPRLIDEEDKKGKKKVVPKGPIAVPPSKRITKKNKTPTSKGSGPAPKAVEKETTEIKNWYVGVAPRVPKHNNGLESFNPTMKRCQTEHRRQPLKLFLPTALAIVRQRSLEYLKDKAPFANELVITDQMMKLGRDLNLKFVVSNEAKPDGSIDFFAFSSSIEKAITLEDVVSYQKHSYKTFKDFVSLGLNIRIITFPRQSSEWKSAQCSCYTFDKSFMCMHIISIADSLGLLSEYEEEELNFDDEPLFSTRRGRPKKTSKALVRE
ncbi:hypothetical protein HA402_009332 [Bradysia odoriphaga]|nr:hypothetical protein HA402_009332 [Bradysia odoriphaga]